MTTPWIAEYIQGVYKYLLGFSMIVAIVMVMIGGLQYIMAAGGGDTKAAKERINNAVVGLILLFSVYLILYTVGGNKLISLPDFRIKEVPGVDLVTEADALQNLTRCKDVKGQIKKCSVSNLKQPAGWTPELTAAVTSAAASTGVDPFLLAAHLQIETNGNTNWPTSNVGTSACGAIGLPQFMPYTFDTFVAGQPKCCSAIAAKNLTDADKAACATSTAWPPPSDVIAHCDTSVCGHCAQAAPSCVDYFTTVGHPERLQQTVDAEAKFVAAALKTKFVNGDRAMEVCTYNGSGAGAVQYEQKAAGYYQKFCADSGGTQP